MKVVQTNKCAYCPHEVDYLEDFLFSCRTTIQFWIQVEIHISLVTGKHF